MLAEGFDGYQTNAASVGDLGLKGFNRPIAAFRILGLETPTR
jgi:hypothetical protein